MLETEKGFDKIKMIDFGTAVVHDGTEPLEETTGTPFYIAPEVLKRNYSSKCDIWSCGVMTYVLVSGVHPFNGNDDDEILDKVRRGRFSMSGGVWNGVSANCKAFITKLLRMNPDERPDCEEVLMDPWICNLASSNVNKDASLDALNNLTKFSADSTMKKATVAFISSHLLSKKEKDGLADVFKSFDKKNDGKLDMQEVKTGYLEHYGKLMTDQEVENMFKAVDTRNTGFIEYSQFVGAAMQ